MAQPIAMDWNPKTNLEKLRTLLEYSEKYGYAHEDLINEIYETMMTWALKQPEFIERYAEDAKENGYDPDDFNSFYDYFIDNYGDAFWMDDVDSGELDKEFAMFTVVMFRFVIGESLFGCNNSYVDDFEAYANKIEEYAKEWFEANKDRFLEKE